MSWSNNRFFVGDNYQSFNWYIWIDCGNTNNYLENPGMSYGNNCDVLYVTDTFGTSFLSPFTLMSGISTMNLSDIEYSI